jgi:hypothetical protein
MNEKKIKQDVSKKQIEIIHLLSKYRFITTHQFQQLLHHKDSHRIKVWLTDLFDKKYVNRQFDRTSFSRSNKPAVYFLSPKARVLLKQDGKELNRTETFISHCLFLVDVYVFLKSLSTKSEEIKFFTKHELGRYTHFPSPLPDAFIAVTSAKVTKRYFLDIIDEGIPSWVIKNRIKQYISCAESSDWVEQTGNVPFPTILLILPTEKLQHQSAIFATSLLDSSFEDISLFLTSKQQLNSGVGDTIWQKVTT